MPASSASSSWPTTGTKSGIRSSGDARYGSVSQSATFARRGTRASSSSRLNSTAQSGTKRATSSACRRRPVASSTRTTPNSTAATAANETPNQAQPLSSGRGSLAREQELGDLDRVQRRALAQVVAREEEREAVLDRRVAADPADEHLVDAGRLARRGEVLDAHRRRRCEQLARPLRRERLLGLEPDRLGVPDEDRHTDAGRLDPQLRQLHDLARLGAELRLLVELVAVEVPIHPQVVVRGRLAAQPLHRAGAGAGDRLVRGEPDAREAGLLVQRLQHAGERNRAAVRVGDDAVVLERALAVHLRHDERDARLEPVGGRLVDGGRASAHGVRHELARRAGADREEENVDPRPLERLRRRLSHLPALDPRPGRARGREDADVLVAALAQERQRHHADGTGAADDADPRSGHGRRVAAAHAAGWNASSSSPCARSQSRWARQAGRRDSTSRQNRREWFASRRWQSSWTTT